MRRVSLPGDTRRKPTLYGYHSPSPSGKWTQEGGGEKDTNLRRRRAAVPHAIFTISEIIVCAYFVLRQSVFAVRLLLGGTRFSS